MQRQAPQPFFLPGSDGTCRCCLYFSPSTEGLASHKGSARGNVVFLPPFADEMNKSRRMVSMQSQLLAENGFAVLQLDLTGCGDSGGDHRDATWSQWVQDGVDALKWLSQRSPGVPTTLWGLRSGCLLACDVAIGWDAPTALLFWNAPSSGRTLWQQFSRLATMAALSSEVAKVRAERVKHALQTGQVAEIAGYEVSPALVEGLEASVLAPPPAPTAAAFLETNRSEGDEISPALLATTQKWRLQGHTVEVRRVQGPAFWQTTEIEDAPALLTATVDAAVQLVAQHQPSP